MPTELDKVMEEIMVLKKDRERLDNSISSLETRIQEIKDDPKRGLIHQPGFMQEEATYPRSVWTLSQSALSVHRDNRFLARKEILAAPLRVDTPAIYDQNTANAWADAFNVLMELRKIEERGDLMCPEDLWRQPGYLITCTGYVLNIQEVGNNTNITATLSPIFVSPEKAEFKISMIGKHRIIQAWRTFMFSADWPGYTPRTLPESEAKETTKK